MVGKAGGASRSGSGPGEVQGPPRRPAPGRHRDGPLPGGRIPVRVWCWPGNASDSALIRQVKDDMRDWSLSCIVWVADRGFSSAQNHRYLRKGGGSYIIGEKLRSGIRRSVRRAVPAGTVSGCRGEPQGQGGADRRGRAVRHLLQPQGANDAALRARIIARLDEAITGSDQLSRDKRAELRGVISTRPGLTATRA